MLELNVSPDRAVNASYLKGDATRTDFKGDFSAKNRNGGILVVVTCL